MNLLLDVAKNYKKFRINIALISVPMPHKYPLPFLILSIATTICLSTITTKAQHTAQDYLVITSGDTLRGQIQLTGKQYQTLKLRRSNNAISIFTASQVSSYGYQNSTLKVSKPVGTINGQAQLLTPLVQGAISLYSGTNAQEEVRYYLQPTDSAYVIEVNPVTAQLTFARQLAGCSDLEFGSTKTQQRYPYSKSGLVHLVTDYNRCRYPQQHTEIVKSSTNLHVSLGIKAGANYSYFNISPLPASIHDQSHSQASGYQAGLYLNLATRTNLSLQLEGNYISLRSNYGSGEPPSYNSGIYTGVYTVRIKYSQIQFPLLLRYTIGHGTLRPYLNAGPSLGFNFSDSSIKNIPNSTNTAYTEEPYSTQISPVSFGAAVGLGLSIQRQIGPTISLELRYDGMVDGKNAPPSNHSSARFDLAVTF